jgi:hypothetical protein
VRQRRCSWRIVVRRIGMLVNSGGSLHTYRFLDETTCTGSVYWT